MRKSTVPTVESPVDSPTAVHVEDEWKGGGGQRVGRGVGPALEGATGPTKVDSVKETPGRTAVAGVSRLAASLV